MDRQQALRRYLVGLLAIGWARPMAFALAALGVAAAGGCEMSGGTPSATPSVAPTVASTAERTDPPPGPAPADFAVTVDGRATDWKTSTHAPGESTDFAHGILFVDIETGAGERWWASGEPVPTEYTVSPNGQWLSATTIWTGTQRVLDRDSARSFSWSTQAQRAVESPVAGGRLLVRSQRSGCTFALIDLGGGEPEIVAFDVPPDDRTCGSTSGVVDSYGRGAFLMVNSDGAGARLFHVDSDGALSEVPLAPAQWRRLSLGADGESVATVAMSGDGGVGALRLDILSWGGRLTRSVSFDQVPLPEKIGPVLLSPDLGSIAWRARIPLPTLQGAGGEEMWPAVVLADLASGSVRYRAVRATLSNGLRSFGWIADGSAVVVGTELGYALLSLDGEIADLPFGPVGHFAPIPLPSPDDPTLFLYDGAVVRVDGASGGATTPKGSAWWRRSSYDWGTTSRELRIKRWDAVGRDFGPGGVAALGLPAFVEYPPFENLIRLRTDRDAPIALRAAAEPGSAIEAMVAPGEEVIVVGCAACDTAAAAVFKDDGNWWIHVTTAMGETGWLPAGAVTWVAASPHD